MKINRKTLKNKISALVLILVSIVPILLEGDGTMFMFALMIGIPMFSAKENWMSF